DPTPLDLYKYAGRGASSWGSPNLRMPFDQWLAAMRKQKPIRMAEVAAYMKGRYDFTPRPRPGAKMSGGKAIMDGPVARLPKGVASFEDLARLGADAIRDRDLFPYKPLAHPLQTTAHMVFTQTWVKAHPEHERIDIDFD